jgi:hypothetical protein
MEQPLHDDLMIGVKPIAKFTGQPARRVFSHAGERPAPRLQARQQMGSEKVNAAAAHR